MKWLLWMLWDPIAALDLADRDGRPDHGKLMGLLGFAGIYLLVLLHIDVSIGKMVVLGSLPFGWVGWRTFLRARTVTSAETVQHTTMRSTSVHHEIADRRDPQLGIEPTP